MATKAKKITVKRPPSPALPPRKTWSGHAGDPAVTGKMTPGTTRAKVVYTSPTGGHRATVNQPVNTNKVVDARVTRSTLQKDKQGKVEAFNPKDSGRSRSASKRKPSHKAS